MRGACWAKCLWPGLPRLWAAGEPQGLLLAFAFAGLLNVALLASFVWCELVAPTVETVLWSVVATWWLGSVAFNRWRMGRTPTHDIDADASLAAATESYLQGHWLETEIQLEQIVRRNSRDVEARLLRATLYRRTGRLDEARHELTQLECLDGAAKWQLELNQERRLLEESDDNTPQDTASQATASEQTTASEQETTSEEPTESETTSASDTDPSHVSAEATGELAPQESNDDTSNPPRKVA